MSQMMMELAELCGFYFEATTFSQLFYYIFMGLSGTAILACTIKAMLYMCFRGKDWAR